MQSDIERAVELFHEMERNGISPDIVSYNTLVNGLSKAKRLEDAMHLQVEMVEANCLPNVVTYTSLMDGLCKDGRVDEAMGLLDDMYARGVDADAFCV